MEQARLLLGDCLEQLGYLEADSVDLIVTSPPYANQRATTYGESSPISMLNGFCPSLTSCSVFSNPPARSSSTSRNRQ